MTELEPAEEGADQPTVIDLSPGLRPVIVGALGESPNVSAFGIVVAPALVVTVKLLVPPVMELGLVKVRVVPESDSVQLATAFEPTEIPVTPTRKLPLTVTEAPPVLGINVLSVLVAVGVCTSEADHVSVTVAEAIPSWRSPCLPSPITYICPSELRENNRPQTK